MIQMTVFWKHATWSNQSFKLSNFGIPEPAGLVWENESPKLSYIIAGVVCLLAMVILLFILMRKKK
jgi:hypothetical protein